MSLNRHRIAVIPGDGIGLEVMPAATAVLERAAATEDSTIVWEWFDWSCEQYVRNGAMMPADGLDVLSSFDGILLGAVGRPDVPDTVSLWGLLIPIRRRFDQYINLRPARSFEGVDSRVVLPAGGSIDMLIVRENTEGEYSEIGGRFAAGTEREFAIQDNVFTRFGIRRVAEFAFELASQRRGKLTSATKSNGIVHTMPFWDEVVNDLAESHAGVECQNRLIDALTADFVLHPQEFDVVVASNLFGDILSDLAGAVVGSLGLAPSANLNPERRFPSMFEPVHGSAPDIAGKGIANPVAAIWSGAMMFDHLGLHTASNHVMSAIEASLRQPHSRTADLGGSANTEAATEFILKALDQ